MATCFLPTDGSHFDPVSATVWNNWTATTANVIWNAWTAPTTGSTTWATWNQVATNVTSNITWQGWSISGWENAAPPLSEGELRQRRAEHEERMVRQRADRDQAVQRAETLLHEHLSERQRRSLRTRGKFRVKGQSGRWYEIARGHHSNVWELDGKGKRVSNLCVYATDGVPEADSMLAQALHLSSNEEHIRRVAHISPTR